MIEWEMLVALVAVVMGSLIILIPMAALALRFASKPVIEAIARYREVQAGPSEHLAVLKERLELIEQRLEGVEDSVDRLRAGKDFDRQLNPPG